MRPPDTPQRGHPRLVVVVLLAAAVACAPQLPPPVDSHHPAVTWAINRFVDAGLNLPETTVVTVADRSSCGGYLTVAKRSNPPTVTICEPSNDTPELRQALVHDLAAIWTTQHVSSDQQTLFYALHTCRTPAETITDVLTKREIRPQDQQVQRAAYTVITKLPPPA